MKKYLVWGLWAIGMGAIVVLLLPKAQATVTGALPTTAQSNKWVTFAVAGAIIAAGAAVLRWGLKAVHLKSA